MIMMKGMFTLFMSLAIGYVLCILASKQKKGVLQTAGYTLGTAIIVLSLLCGALGNCATMCRKGKMAHICCKGMKHGAGVFAKGQVK